MTIDEVRARIEGLPEEQQRSVACALLGHSLVQHVCFGYWSCARCGQQIGDTLGSRYEAAKKAVAVDHHCATCRENAKALTEADRFLLPTDVVAYLDVLADEPKSIAAAEAAQREYAEAMATLRQRRER